MKTMQTLFAAVSLSTGLLSANAANAALESRLGGQAYYDTSFGITWIANANLSASNTFGVSGIQADGAMNWNTAQDFIAAMNSYDGGRGYLGANNWRLPTTLQPDPSCSFQSQTSSGYGCRGSELGHLFYDEFGGVSGNFGPFTNAQPHYYWSGTPATAYYGAWDGSAYQWLPIPGAWTFNFQPGYQAVDNTGVGYMVWAVRSGDVSSVPAPAAAWLLGSGLLGLVGVARRKAV